MKVFRIIYRPFQLLIKGVLFDFLRVTQGDRRSKSQRSSIESSCNRLRKKLPVNSGVYLLATECLAEIKMLNLDFRSSAQLYEKAIALRKQHGLRLAGDSSIYRCLASCYINSMEKRKSLEVIVSALREGVEVESFGGLVDVKELEAAIDQLHQKTVAEAGTGSESSNP